MELVLAALLGLVGSSAAAAVISTKWQQTKYRLDKHSNATTGVISEHYRLRSAIGRCLGLLSIQRSLGKVWSYQKDTFEDSLQIISQAQASLDESRAHLSNAEPDLAGELAQLQATAAETASILGTVYFDRYDGKTIEGGITIAIPGRDLDDVIADLQQGLARMGEQGRVAALALARHETALLNSSVAVKRVFGVLGVGIVLAALYIVFVGAWESNVQDDKVVWTNTVTQQVRVTSLPVSGQGQASPVNALEPAPTVADSASAGSRSTP